MPEKSRSEVLGQPVLSINEGLLLGRVRQILLDVTEKSVQALVVERFRGGKEDRLLPFNAISSFGDDGVMVESQNRLEKRGVSQQFTRALRHPLPLIGARVFTASGRTLGKVEEYLFSTEDGRISGLEISGGLFRGSMLAPGRHIIALSPQTIMMRDAAVDEATAVEKPLLANMSEGLENVRERAAALKTSAADAGRSLSANLSEAIGRRKEAGAETTLDASEEEEELSSTPPAAQ